MKLSEAMRFLTPGELVDPTPSRLWPMLLMTSPSKSCVGHAAVVPLERNPDAGRS